jgi:branched-chain amino acid transport system permease protein
MQKIGRKSFWLIVLIILLILPNIISSFYTMHLINVALIYVILTIGYDFVFGRAGQVSFAQVAFFGIGSYFSALLTVDYGLSFWVAMPIAVVASGLIAVILGIPVFRLKGHYLSIATMGLAMIVQQVLINWIDVTHGVLGVKNIPSPSFFGIDLAGDRHYYYLILFFLVASIMVAININKSHVGQSFVALRRGEFGLEAVGVNTMVLKIQAFALSGVYGGLAGALYAHLNGYISPDFYGMSQIIVFLAMMVIGGRCSILGATIGSVLITFLPEWLRFLADYYMAVYAAILILLMIFMPSGLAGLINMLKGRLLAWKKGTAKKGVSMNGDNS